MTATAPILLAPRRPLPRPRAERYPDLGVARRVHFPSYCVAPNRTIEPSRLRVVRIVATCGRPRGAMIHRLSTENRRCRNVKACPAAVVFDAGALIAFEPGDAGACTRSRGP